MIEQHASLSPVVAFLRAREGYRSGSLLPVTLYHWSAGHKLQDDKGFAYKAVGYGRQEARRELAEVIRGLWPNMQDPEL